MNLRRKSTYYHQVGHVIFLFDLSSLVFPPQIICPWRVRKHSPTPSPLCLLDLPPRAVDDSKSLEITRVKRRLRVALLNLGDVWSGRWKRSYRSSLCQLLSYSFHGSQLWSWGWAQSLQGFGLPPHPHFSSPTTWMATNKCYLSIA